MDFRRWFTALAVLALFAGLAGAQTIGGTGSALVCNSVAQVTPQLRAEGVTELVGDIVITCTGGQQIATGGAIPTTNVTVSLTAPVTSRLLNQPAPAVATGQTEALLLIDEPQSLLAPLVAGWGPAAAYKYCNVPTTPLPTCGQFAYPQTVITGAIPALDGQQVQTQSSASGSAVAPYNVFQGLLTGTNQLQFLGIPVLPPVTAGIQRVFRITNIRVNASAAGSSIVGGVQQVQAIISTSNSAALPISAVGGNAAVTVGYVQPSLATRVIGSGTFTQCNRNFTSIAATSADRTDIVPVPNVTPTVLTQPANVALLEYRELFPSAFKTRIAANATVNQSTTSVTTLATIQVRPGQQYASESGLTLAAVTNGNADALRIAGLADTGTRFQAVFAGLPTGASIYVTTANVEQDSAVPGNWVQTTTPATVGLDSIITSNAVLVSGTVSGSSVLNAYGISTLPVRQLAVSGGAATAVWEVRNTQPAAFDTFRFGILIAYASMAPALQSGTATVTMSYNPLDSATSTAIPRFISNSTAQAGWLTIIPCQTVLLFPYVTSSDGFDTGMAISNTALDPLGTQSSNGVCRMNFYGRNAPTSVWMFPDGSTAGLQLGVVNTTVTPNILPTRAMLASQAATNFVGYVFAVCDFQFAHGFAFVSDVGANRVAMGYLALVVNNGSNPNVRGTTVAAEALNN